MSGQTLNSHTKFEQVVRQIDSIWNPLKWNLQKTILYPAYPQYQRIILLIEAIAKMYVRAEIED